MAAFAENAHLSEVVPNDSPLLVRVVPAGWVCDEACEPDGVTHQGHDEVVHLKTTPAGGGQHNSNNMNRVIACEIGSPVFLCTHVAPSASMAHARSRAPRRHR